MHPFTVHMDFGGVLGVFVDDEALTVVQFHFVFDEVTQEGGEQDTIMTDKADAM